MEEMIHQIPIDKWVYSSTIYYAKKQDFVHYNYVLPGAQGQSLSNSSKQKSNVLFSKSEGKIFTQGF